MKKEVFCKNKNFVITYPKSFYNMEKFHGMSFLFEHADIFIFLALGFLLLALCQLQRVYTALMKISKKLQKISKNKKLPSGEVVVFKWRRDRDSNPGALADCRFSRPVHSTTLPSLQDVVENSASSI